MKGMQIKMMPARVMKLARAAPDVTLLELKLPANDKFLFLAGQYVDLILRDGTRRSFSMANAPHDDAFLHLHLRNYGGPFSQHVFGTMKEKDILRIEGRSAPSSARGQQALSARERHGLAPTRRSRTRSAQGTTPMTSLGLPGARDYNARSRRALAARGQVPTYRLSDEPLPTTGPGAGFVHRR